MKENKINTINCEDTFGSIKETGMQVQQLLETLESQLKSHDWFYEYSDDARYYKSGQREFMQIWNTIEELQKLGENQFDQAIAMYKNYKPVVNTPHEKLIGKNY